jgi:hypothetical protein
VTGDRTVYLTNRSDESVFEVTVRVSGAETYDIWELPARATAHAKVKTTPDPAAVRRFSAGVYLLVVSVSATAVEEVVTGLPEISFRDALGRAWKRSTSGHLKRSSHLVSKSTHIESKVQALGFNYRVRNGQEENKTPKRG